MNVVCRRTTFVVLVGISLGSGGESVSEGIRETKLQGRDYLSRKEFERNWISYSESGKEESSPWSLRDQTEDPNGGPLLVCTGKPDGYLRTTEILGEYCLRLEWRFPLDPHGNSGILLHVGTDDKVWPESVQVQLHTPSVGSVFPTSGAATRSILNTPPSLKVNPQEWNRCEIWSSSGVLRIQVNDVWIGDVIGCDPQRGHIALQSEGSEVHFRNLEIRPLSDTERRALSEKDPELSRRKGRKSKRRG